jgi:hypothetical protein
MQQYAIRSVSCGEWEMNVQQLQQKAAGLKVRIRDLTSERERLSPLAIKGHDNGPQAKARIVEIDTERQQHVSDLETTEAAQRAAFKAEREAKERAPKVARRQRFDRDKAGLGRVLVGIISARYDRLAYSVAVAMKARRNDEARSMIEGYQLAHVTCGVNAGNPPRTPLAEIPMVAACELCSSPSYMGSFDALMMVPNFEYVEGEHGQPGRRVQITLAEQNDIRAKRKKAFDAEVAALAEEVLALVTLPPAPAELQRLVTALKAGGREG